MPLREKVGLTDFPFSVLPRNHRSLLLFRLPQVPSLLRLLSAILAHSPGPKSCPLLLKTAADLHTLLTFHSTMVCPSLPFRVFSTLSHGPHIAS